MIFKHIKKTKIAFEFLKSVRAIQDVRKVKSTKKKLDLVEEKQEIEDINKD